MARSRPSQQLRCQAGAGSHCDTCQCWAQHRPCGPFCMVQGAEAALHLCCQAAPTALGTESTACSSRGHPTTAAPGVSHTVPSLLVLAAVSSCWLRGPCLSLGSGLCIFHPCHSQELSWFPFFLSGCFTFVPRPRELES